MKTKIFLGILFFLVAGSAFGLPCDKDATTPPPDGWILGECIGVTSFDVWVSPDSLKFRPAETRFTIRVSKASPWADTIMVFTPGKPFGWTDMSFPGESISSVSIGKGEFVYLTYRLLGEDRRPFILKCWPAWTVGTPVWETMIGTVLAVFFDIQKDATFEDRIQLYTPEFRIEVFDHPTYESRNNLSFVKYAGQLVLADFKKVGTLREIQATEKHLK